MEVAHDTERACRVLVQNRFDQPKYAASAGDAENRRDLGLGYFAAERGDRGFEHPLRVAHTAAGLAREHPQRRFLGLDALAPCQFLEPLENDRERDTAEIVALEPRQNRLGHFLRLGRREDEFDVRGRFLERFEQRVEGLVRELMRFIDDVNLEAVPRRRESQRMRRISRTARASVPARTRGTARGYVPRWFCRRPESR